MEAIYTLIQELESELEYYTFLILTPPDEFLPSSYAYTCILYRNQAESMLSQELPRYLQIKVVKIRDQFQRLSIKISIAKFNYGPLESDHRD